MANGSNASRSKKPIFLGILFPYAKGPEGYPATATDLDIVKSDLDLLLNTRKRERVHLPDFGLDLERLIFENTGPLLRAKAYRQIADAVANYEPRVSITSIAVEDNKSTVFIDVQYIINGFRDNLVVKVPRESNG